MSGATTTDRAAALRGAVRAVVAERGLHGASMSQIANAAGVAAGTAYVHYRDKDDLVVAAYVEAKQQLAAAALSHVADVLDAPDGRTDPVRERMVAIFVAVARHLRAHPTDAQFILQVDTSPYSEAAHARVVEEGDDLTEALDDPALRARLEDLPDPVLYELGLAPAIRLAARGIDLTDDQLRAVATACWGAVSRD